MPNGMKRGSMPDACHIAVTPEVMAAAIKRLRATERLGADLTRQVADLDQKLLLFRRYAALAHELRVDLKATDRV